MIKRIINKFKDKIKNKHFAVFVDENGKQREIININNDENKFKIKNKVYIKNSNKYSNFTLKKKVFYFFLQYRTYFFYQYDYSEPINFTKQKLHINNTGQPYIAEDINSILETKVLKDLNKISFNPFSNIEPKQAIIILAIIGGIIYFVTNGGF